MAQEQAVRVEQAVVLGAGMAGLAAAASLARRARKVTVLDQDELSGTDGPRRGVPQGRHVHLLLPAGLAALERLLPGLERELVDAGAVALREPEDFAINIGTGRLELSRLSPGFVLMGATRPLLEGIVRERIRMLPNVRLLGGVRAQGLTVDGSGAVTGVNLGGATVSSAAEELRADLVVDATGRGSRSPRWLEELGYPAPTEEVVRVDVRYTSRFFRRAHEGPRGARNVLVAPPPGVKRGAVALAVEGERWIVTLTGLLGERPPGDLDGFLAYARSLWCSDVYAIAAREEPLGEAVTGSYPANARRRYDRLSRFPGGFVVLGDALTPFNPMYAQGMSMAAIEAELLGATIDRVGPERIGPAFYRSIKAQLEDAWSQAVGNDLRHPDVEGDRGLQWRLINSYSRRLLPLAYRDPIVGSAFFDVMGLLAPGSSLMRPAVLGRVLLRGGQPGVVPSGEPVGGG